MKMQRFASVWNAIEGADAANMKARAEMMIAICEAVENWDVSQRAAAERFGLTPHRLNELRRGRINKFNLDSLQEIATRAALAVASKS